MGERKIILLMGMGLNGLSAEGWIPPAETPIQIEEMIEDVWNLLQSVDTLIIGRVTFQLWENYWPSRANDRSSSEFQKKFSIFVEHIQKLVCTTTLTSTTWQNSRIIKGNLQHEISRIKKLPGKDIALVGGPGIAQSFVELNLIDDYQIYLHPTIFKSGKSLLKVLDEDRMLNLVETRNFQSGGIRLHFHTIK